MAPRLLALVTLPLRGATVKAGLDQVGPGLDKTAAGGG
jgi:hypothetical protein